MKLDQVRSIALFFALGLMDQKSAQQAAQKTIASLKAKFGDRPSSPDATLWSTAAVLSECRKQWKTHARSLPGHRVRTGDEHFVIPSDFDLQVWRRYQKDAPEEDVMATLMKNLFHATDEELAEGLQTSVGTIRFRLGKSVRQLGLSIRSQPKDGPIT